MLTINVVHHFADPDPHHSHHPHGDYERECLALIFAKLEHIMTTVAALAATLTSVKSELGVVSTTIGGVASNISVMNQMIADLKAQIEAGTPVSQDQLDALGVQASSIDADLQQVAAALAPLATLDPADDPVPTAPPVVVIPPDGSVPPVEEPPVDPSAPIDVDVEPVEPPSLEDRGFGTK